MSKILKTPKGTELPLVNLKGKQYLLVAHRIQWFNEEVDNFSIETEFLHLTEDETVAKSTVKIKDKEGNVIKQVSATKRETKKDFSDHTEKAETGSIGRCLATIGFGTQFALADLDEGHRIVDAPLEDIKAKASTPAAAPPKPDTPKASGFSRKPADVPKTTETSDDGWQ